MLPPRILYNALVKNQHNSSQDVVATYDLDGKSIKEFVTIPSGGEYVFKKKIEENDTYQVAYNIVKIEVANSSYLEGPFVNSPTDIINFTISGDASLQRSE